MTLPPQRFPIARRGHASMPGSGPQGETCRTCEHGHKRNTGYGFVEFCALTQAMATKRGQSAIALRDPACAKWTAKGQPVEEKTNVPG
jgi:hypothetical protein